MAVLHYTAEAKGGRILELPVEAERLHLKPGDKVQVQLDHVQEAAPSISLQERKRPSALGKYAFVAGGSEEFAREKRDELAREENSRK